MTVPEDALLLMREMVGICEDAGVDNAVETAGLLLPDIEFVEDKLVAMPILAIAFDDDGNPISADTTKPTNLVHKFMNTLKRIKHDGLSAVDLETLEVDATAGITVAFIIDALAKLGSSAGISNVLSVLFVYRHLRRRSRIELAELEAKVVWALHECGYGYSSSKPVYESTFKRDMAETVKVTPEVIQASIDRLAELGCVEHKPPATEERRKQPGYNPQLFLVEAVTLISSWSARRIGKDA